MDDLVLNLKDNAPEITLPRHHDLTFYLPCDQFKKCMLVNVERWAQERQKSSYSGNLEIFYQDARLNGRALICKCKVGTEDWYSITIRLKVIAGSSCEKWLKASNGLLGSDISTHWTTTLKSTNANWGNWWNNSAADNRFLRNIKHVSQSLDNAIPTKDFPKGLIVLCGSTDCSKTLIAQSLMSHLLLRYQKDNRWPHVVTLEDPVEDPLFSDLASATSYGVNYTARARGVGKDSYPTIGNAVDDALRQTPAIFYVSEVRSDDDWAPLLRLAGTGHLVVTTTHAFSVTECLSKILFAMKANTPALRSQVASKLCAVIHLTPVKAKSANAAYGTVLPAMWRATPKSINDLVAVGLASLLPFHHCNLDAAKSEGSLGRSTFVETMKSRRPDSSPVNSDDDWEKVINGLLPGATSMDNRGL